ncbi:unnamed protein product [Rotaria sp. Silwood2]|nr:unnamed protein product [Rotaria sp. Silwood2]
MNQIIPYCRRLGQNEAPNNVSHISHNNVNNIISFHELYKQGITSAQLLDWSAPIDVAEKYEMTGADSTESFYNCSSPWFGSKCQYRFDNILRLSFSDIVRLEFSTRSSHLMQLEYLNVTCYSFLNNCISNAPITCLDWRHICDGKFDCINGKDEEGCQILETNECSNDTYRCHFGGQCIPLAFVRDGPNTADCLDGTDEIHLHEESIYRFNSQCFRIPTFRCEERTGPYQRSFPCGDGQYYLADIIQTVFSCANFRQWLEHKYRMLVESPILYNIPEKIFQSTLASSMLYLQPILNNTESMFSIISCVATSKKCLSKWIFKAKLFNTFWKFHFVYLPYRLVNDLITLKYPDFICFHVQDCPASTNCVIEIGLDNGLVCCPSSKLLSTSFIGNSDLSGAIENLFFRCSTTGVEQSCPHPSLFHCPLSLKCISKHRLLDGISDCYFGEDEAFDSCHLNDSRRFICESEPNKCLSPILLQNGNKDCKSGEDELTENQRNMLKGAVPFGLLCNGKNDQLLSESNDTDETNCEYWPCNNIYTQCDHVKDCADGVDELNCPIIKCESYDDEVRNTLLSDKICFSLMALMEKYLSCDILYTEYATSFNTMINNNKTSLSSIDSCIHTRHICPTPDQMYGSHVLFFSGPSSLFFPTVAKYWLSQIEKHICPFTREPFHTLEITEWTFKLSQLGYFPPKVTMVSKRNSFIIKNEPLVNLQPNYKSVWYCNRGISIHFNDQNTKKCLCPPSYFGDRCQWQNQRISLTLQLVYRTDAYIMAAFQVVLMLIDEQSESVSYHEQITFVPKRDCETKYNIYLLYPNQPKNSSTNYSIHIDLFEKMTLNYLGSWHLSIPFQFLPVNRIAAQLFIPSSKIISKSCSLFCGKHGRCAEYMNKNFSYFCQCNEGYSGSQCNIQHNCSCSLDSYCFTSSICVCPLHKFGSMCYLKNSICQIPNKSCQNNGICIPHDDRTGLNNFTCLCTEDFFGTRCENVKNRIDIAFNDENIDLMPIIWIHFITLSENGRHQRSTVLNKIKFAQNVINTFTIDPFHAVFIELANRTYYLIVLRERFIESEYIQTKILSNYRCSSIYELMNNTFSNYSLLRRVKYYPHLCQQKEQVKCFYDEIYMCICDANRFSNCFTFNHTISHDCQGENICENDGLCFQDTVKCPLLSICVCPACYYGTKCQFSTRGFALSLDYILGYNIKPNVSIYRQPFVIKISIAIVVVMFILGLVSGMLSIITFQRKIIRKNGCSIYLLVSSWNSLCLTIVLMIKFWQLLLSQISIITNRLFLTWNCILLDMTLKVLVASNDWFYACIALERVFTVIQGVSFNQLKSKKVAKWIFPCIFLITILTHIQDPIHRRLIDDIDVDEKRTWCLAQYSSALNTFNMFITLFHFLVPFSVNIISTILTIKQIARSRWQTQTAIPFSIHLRQHFNQHKRHLFASCALILLALPRLIISFISGCMKSPRNPWLYLFGYFISFTPSMITFIVFILPSKQYKDDFMTAIRHIIQRFHTCLGIKKS